MIVDASGQGFLKAIAFHDEKQPMTKGGMPNRQQDPKQTAAPHSDCLS